MLACLGEVGQTTDSRKMERNIVDDFRRQFREHRDVERREWLGLYVICKAENRWT